MGRINERGLSIKQWDTLDRPREKLVEKGRLSLTEAELLAILLGTGNRGESALDLARRILNGAGNNLGRLASFSIKELMEYKGVGVVKATNIVTALELGRRRRHALQDEKSKIVSSQSVFELMQPLIGDLKHEEFWIVFLNGANRVEAKVQLSKGGMTATLVDVRLIFKLAIQHGATSLILCHNHPSGNLTPSDADKKLTEKIIRGGRLLDVKIIDHVIITEQGHFSFVDEDLL